MKIDYIKDIGKFHYYKVDEIDSTNNYFKNNYMYYADNSVLSAIIQKNGRGRFTRKWESSDDICFSILFKKDYPNSIISSLAIIETLKKFNIDAVIKWPNDILINSKKLAGILIENIYESSFIASIVGIGINVHSKEQYNSIGLNDVINNHITNDYFIEMLLNTYESLLKKDFSELISLYTKYNYVIGKEIIYLNETYLALGIDDNGYLIISNNGNNKIITGNEIDVKIKIK